MFKSIPSYTDCLYWFHYLLLFITPLILPPCYRPRRHKHLWILTLLPLCGFQMYARLLNPCFHICVWEWWYHHLPDLFWELRLIQKLTFEFFKKIFLSTNHWNLGDIYLIEENIYFCFSSINNHLLIPVLFSHQNRVVERSSPIVLLGSKLTFPLPRCVSSNKFPYLLNRVIMASTF